MSNMEDLIQVKQQEFIFLLEDKEKENLILSAELLQLKSQFDLGKTDRIKDQKINLELQNENYLLNAKLNEYKNHLDSIRGKVDNNYEIYRNNLKKSVMV
jgi:hypothetical protein